MNLNLPAATNLLKQAKERLQTAAAGTGKGSGTGETYMRVDDRTGAYTFGKERAAVPLDRPYVVGLHTFRHGWKYFEGNRMTNSRVVSMLQEPNRPNPSQDIGEDYQEDFGKAGPRNVTGLQLQCLKETGFVLTYEAMGVSSANRIRNLLEEAIANFGTEVGQAGFIHPIIALKVNGYTAQIGNQQRKIYHFDYTLVDWTNGTQLASEADLDRLAGPVGDGSDEGEIEPWDDDTEALAGMVRR